MYVSATWIWIYLFFKHLMWATFHRDSKSEVYLDLMWLMLLYKVTLLLSRWRLKVLFKNPTWHLGGSVIWTWDSSSNLIHLWKHRPWSDSKFEMEIVDEDVHQPMAEWGYARSWLQCQSSQQKSKQWGLIIAVESHIVPETAYGQILRICKWTGQKKPRSVSKCKCSCCSIPTDF